MFEGLERLKYQPGDQIFREGERGDCAYLVEAGSVDISTRKNNKFFRISILGEGELFGEMALIDNAPRTATVTALEETRVVRIGRGVIDTELRKGSPIIEHLLRLVLKRFRHTHDRLTGNDPATNTNDISDKAFSETQQNLIRHIKVASDINQGIKQKEFLLYYQPIMSIADHRLVGFEALIRWLHPQDGILLPKQFLNVAEDTKQILQIGAMSLEQACHDLRSLNENSINTGQDPVFICVNISARQLSNARYTEQFAAIIENAGIKPEQIKLEVTETILIEEPDHAQKILSALGKHGFKICLDDFGTGYSSLSHLQKFPVDTIKIDRSFVSRMLSENGSMQIVKGSIDLALAMGLDVVAEGVESEQEVEQLNQMKCQYAQGYYYSQPLPIAEAINLLKR